MHAYLLVTSDKSIAEKKARELFPNASRIVNYKIEKITDTRELVRETNISLKPTVYLIDGFGAASTEAQNAFLKRLEEPQENLFFVLTTTKEEHVLPTVISRCQIIRVGKKTVSPETVQSAYSFVNLGINERLEKISKITKREDATGFLGELVSGLGETLSENPVHKDALKAADLALSRINQNGNPTIQLTCFAISF